MVTGRIYRAFLVIFNHSKNIHWWQNNQLEIRNHVHSYILNTATGPILGFCVLLKDTSVCIMQGSRIEPVTFFHWSDHTTTSLTAGRWINGEQAEGS